MKKRIFIYQRIAAVSIGVLIMFGVYSWLTRTNDVPNELTLESQSNHESNKSHSNTVQQSNPSNSNSEGSSIDDSIKKNKAMIKKPPVNKSIDGRSHSNNSFVAAIIPDKKLSQHDKIIGSDRTTAAENELIKRNYKKQYQFTEGPIAELNLLDISRLPSLFEPNDYSIAYRVADARPAVMIKKKREAIHENSFAALSFAAGSFSPGAGSAPAMDATNRSYTGNYSVMQDSKSTNISNVKQENVKPGTSFAMAISAGKRIFKRFILQGGVSYFNQNSSSTSQIVNVAPANEVVAVNSFKPETTNSVTYQSQQDINSTFQFISVPVQLGYMIVDRKFGVQINGGLSPDFFLGNSIYNESTQVETNGSSGEDGAFNTVSLAGLGSIEFSYKFFNHYRLSLAPGIKYSLTSIYNENTFASAKPLVADIGLRFRYIF